MKIVNTLCCVFLLSVIQISKECGPGSATSRDKARKPMVLNQRLPDVDEESISGSGMFRKMVTRDSDAFKRFVSNHNKDIVFDGNRVSSRLMTPRCSQKLNKLAVLVKREWPNTKLRVIGAYDEHGQHPPNSLHYEGRAVDIATSDRDRSKIGVLGVLAFRAGFDWVYYESRSFIHASVISEKEITLKYAECFPGSSKVTTGKRGIITIDQLRIGDTVLTYKQMNDEWKPIFTEVLGFLDREREVERMFIRLDTVKGIALETTKSHLVFGYDATSPTSPKENTEVNFAADFKQARSSTRPSKVHFCKKTGQSTTLQRNNITTTILKKSANINLKPLCIQKTTSHLLGKTVPGLSFNYASVSDHKFVTPKIVDQYSSRSMVSDGIHDKQKPSIGDRLCTANIQNRSSYCNHTCKTVALFADSVKIGTKLLAVASNSVLAPSDVVNISSVRRLGAYAPLTKEGSLIVNGVLVSCYAKVSEAETAHNAFAVYRFLAAFLPVKLRDAVLQMYVDFLIAINELLSFVTLY